MLNIDYIKDQISERGISVNVDDNENSRLGVKITFTKTVGEHERSIDTYPQKRAYESDDDYIEFIIGHFENLIP